MYVHCISFSTVKKKYNIYSSVKEYYEVVNNKLSKGTIICSQSLKSQLFSCPCS